VRPRKLSVTEIEKWLRDPYAIYAKHILRLKPLDPLDDEVGPLERGTAIHDALETFLKRYPDVLPPDAEAKLIAIADEVFAQAAIPHAALALWRPRFDNAAHWFVGEERERKRNVAQSYLEISGTRAFAGPAGEFTLRCRADRIDVLKDGGVAVIDYKTGNVPSARQVETLLQPQLPLEAAILKNGGFEKTGPLAATELLYIRFSGGKEPGKISPVGEDVPALVEEAERRLIARIEDFDRPDKPYHAQVAPVTARQTGDYEHLERVREWLAGGWESSE
jgi:ATP-dependent helicase/nuclease subunit B